LGFPASGPGGAFLAPPWRPSGGSPGSPFLGLHRAALEGLLVRVPRAALEASLDGPGGALEPISRPRTRGHPGGHVPWYPMDNVCRVRSEGLGPRAHIGPRGYTHPGTAWSRRTELSRRSEPSGRTELSRGTERSPGTELTRVPDLSRKLKSERGACGSGALKRDLTHGPSEKT
jgi:hypothetical protein